jgi:hypothetical protein
LNTFLFEAAGAAYGSAFTATPTLEFETVIQYANGTTTSKIQAVALDLRDIKRFYTRWDIDYGVNGGVPGTDLREDLTFQHFTTPMTATHSSQVVNEPFLGGPDTLVYVHGWNVPDDVGEDWKAAVAETTFKRMYWQGFRGEFVALNWPTYANSEGPIEPPFEDFNFTYNPSDLNAYRSALALRNILEDYRGEFPNLQPVHVMAHSMGNIVVGEAMRHWAADPDTTDPLVTNYVAMEAAVSAGAYGSNDTDSVIVGRPIPDLYRFWSHGRDAFADPSLGLLYYFFGVNFSWENAINFYNAEDVALEAWDANNIGKEAFIQAPIWPYDYEFTPGDGENVNNDTFTRVPDVGAPVNLTLVDEFGRPGRDAYEILAFFSQSASLALGTKEVTYFDVNVNIEDFGMLGGSDIRANHSYQFNHDSAETWDFYERIKMETGFGASHGAGAIAINQSSNQRRTALVAAVQEPVVDSRVDLTAWLPPGDPSPVLRSTGKPIGKPISEVRSFITADNADLALLQWSARRVPTDDALPETDFSDHNVCDGPSNATMGEFYEAFDNLIDVTIG